MHRQVDDGFCLYETNRFFLGLRLGYIQSKVGIISALTKYKFSLHESTKPPFEISPGHILLSFKRDPLLDVTRL